nr:hypothetical protein [Parvularcula mediterranea]
MRLAADGAECLVSIGLAGALMDHLQTGDVLLPREVLNRDGDRFAVHPLSQELPRPADGAPLLGSDDLVTSAEEKARLGSAYGASAVDMESHAVAMVAQQRHLPLYVIRVVADPADQAFPPSALSSVKEDGSVDTLKTLGKLLGRPADLPELMKLGSQASKALEVLRKDGRALINSIARA